MSASSDLPQVRYLRRFLEGRGWSLQRERELFLEYRPPDSLDLPGDFSLVLPTRQTAPDFLRSIYRIMESLSLIYDMRAEQMDPVLRRAATVLSLSVEGETTADGSIPFEEFDSLLERLKKMLIHTASFVADGDAVIDDSAPEALTYLHHCRFLQTTHGSFVANVELPAELVLREKDMFGDALMAGVVDMRLERLLEFVNEQVLQNDAAIFSDEHIAKNPQLVNLNVMEDVRALFEQAGDASLTFRFVRAASTKDVASGVLKDDQKSAMDEYVRFLRSRLLENVHLDVTGKVVELRSRNPEGANNRIVVAGVVENEATVIAATLDKERYNLAVQAHREKKSVRMRGIARRMKTQIKMVEIIEFQIVSSGVSSEPK